MTEQSGAQYQANAPEQQVVRRKNSGLVTFAGVLLIVAGGFHIINGVVAVFANQFYVSTPNYLFAFDVSGWGWFHLVLGLVVLAAGFGVLAGQTWGRVTGIVVAVLSAIANFAFLPYYPFWAMTIIALDIIVIWALATQEPDAVV